MLANRRVRGNTLGIFQPRNDAPCGRFVPAEIGMSQPRKRMRPKRKAECGTKQRFETMEKAEAAAYRPRSLLQAHGFMRAYKCKRCAFYHYGHTNKP